MKKAWMSAMTHGSKSLQTRLAKIHANNPEFQEFVKNHGFGGNLSAKQSEKQQKSSIATVAPITPTTPENKIGPKDREDMIRAAAEKAKHRRQANANRVAFGGELGGGFVLPRSSFRKYSEAYGDKVIAPLLDKHYIAYHPETKIIKKIGSNRHINKYVKKYPEYKIGYTSWNDKKIGDIFNPIKLGESKKKIELGKRIPQLPGPKGGHPIPTGYKRVKDIHGFNVLQKIKENIKYMDGVITMKRGGWVAMRGSVQIGPATTNKNAAKSYIRSSKKNINQKLSKVLNMKKREIALGLGRFNQVVDQTEGTQFINPAHVKISNDRYMVTGISKDKDLPFEPDPPKKNPGVTIGKNRPAGLSRARWLARMAMKKEINKEKNNKVEDTAMIIKKKNLTELKKSTLISYIKKAAPDIRTSTSVYRSLDADAGESLRKANKHHPLNFDPNDPEGLEKNPERAARYDKEYKDTTNLANKFARDARNRIKGIKRAAGKLWTNEETVVEAGKNPYGSGFKLVHSKTGKQFKVGDKIKDEGELHTILGWQHGSQRGNPNSSGRILTKHKSHEQEFFPHVFDMKVIKEDSAIMNLAKNTFNSKRKELNEKEGK